MIKPTMDASHIERQVIVACPDARPPAYQAALGLSRAGVLHRFVTSTYYSPEFGLARTARRWAPRQCFRWERTLLRRHCAGIPADRISTLPSVDVALWLERRLVKQSKALVLKRIFARARTVHFDRHLSRTVMLVRPSALMVFSDVGSALTLPLCHRLGIPTVLSMVHGDIAEEDDVLKQEIALAKDFASIYLGEQSLDHHELKWLHQRRLWDIMLADLILVPSNHIAQKLHHRGIESAKIQVVPYAADTLRFQPPTAKKYDSTCTFLFAGAVTQRKGLKYLLEAWTQVRRPGWKLKILGPLPSSLGPLASCLDQIELAGPVPHHEMPIHMASADVFVFPSLFEGSAVVTYEALATGLPTIATTSSGSVLRHGIDGFLTAPRDVTSLAQYMHLLGNSPQLRARMSTAARIRALAFDWSTYHAAIVQALNEVSKPPSSNVSFLT